MLNLDSIPLHKLKLTAQDAFMKKNATKTQKDLKAHPLLKKLALAVLFIV